MQSDMSETLKIPNVCGQAGVEGVGMGGGDPVPGLVWMGRQKRISPD